MKEDPMPRSLAAASSRLSQLIEEGGRSFDAELRRRLAETVSGVSLGDAVHTRPDSNDAESVAAGFVPGAGEIERMRDALGLALALLDDVLEASSGGADHALLDDIAMLFDEIGGFAAAGAKAAKRANGGGV